VWTATTSAGRTVEFPTRLGGSARFYRPAPVDAAGFVAEDPPDDDPLDPLDPPEDPEEPDEPDEPTPEAAAPEDVEAESFDVEPAPEESPVEESAVELDDSFEESDAPPDDPAADRESLR